MERKRFTRKEVITDAVGVDHVLSNHVDDISMCGQRISIYSYDIKSTKPSNKRWC